MGTGGSEDAWHGEEEEEREEEEGTHCTLTWQREGEIKGGVIKRRDGRTGTGGAVNPSKHDSTR